MITLVRVSVDWPGSLEQVMPFLAAGHAEGAHRDWSIEQILDRVRCEEWAMYATVREDKVTGAGVVCVAQYGLRRVLEIILFGAEPNSYDWQQTMSDLKQLARRLGCSAISGRGRPGWARYLGATPTNSWELEV
jgi:hypothetical protein